MDLEVYCRIPSGLYRISTCPPVWNNIACEASSDIFCWGPRISITPCICPKVPLVLDMCKRKVPVDYEIGYASLKWPPTFFTVACEGFNMPMEESEKAGSLCVAKYGIWTIPKNTSEKPLKNPKYRGGASTQIQRRRYLLEILSNMGCIMSTSQDIEAMEQKPGTVNEVVVFVPGLRVPKGTDFGNLLHASLSASMVEQLSALRTRIVVMAAEEGPTIAKIKRKTATQHGGATLADLQLALEDYLPVLLGLAKFGNQLNDLVEFSWINQQDDEKETVLSNAWYEVLSVLHMMAMLSLLQANSLLIPRAPADSHQPKVSEENKKTAIGLFLKAAGYLDYGVRYILTRIPDEVKMKLPIDLQEGVLQAISLQALGQGVELQLGMAIDCPKATLAVKRRLACEKVKYWRQAQYCISNLRLTNGWGLKHLLVIKWKYAEAKAAAYYYHGLILDESTEENVHAKAVSCFHAAEQFLKESKTACINFCLAAPVTRVPPVWGAMKYLSDKILKDASSKELTDGAVQKLLEGVPKLPDFPVALKPDEYEMPPIDPSWTIKVEMGCSPTASTVDQSRDGMFSLLQLQEVDNQRTPLSVA